MSFKKLSLVVMVFFTLLLIFSEDKTDISNLDAEFERAKQLYAKKSYKNAFDIYEKLLMNVEFAHSREAYEGAIYCLGRSGKVSEIDDFREKVLKTNEANPVLRIVIATSYVESTKHGYFVNNKFYRGSAERVEGSIYASTVERDRVRALQIMEGTKDFLGADAILKGDYHVAYAKILMSSRSGYSTWALQDLTDLSVLPEHDKGGKGLRHQDAPVDKDGNPATYKIPESFAKAENDAQRWRFHLEEAKKSNPKLKGRIDYMFACFLLSQWGGDTLGYDWGSRFDSKKGDSNYSLETLSDNETLCRLATGIKRFRFPDGHNYIEMLKDIANSDDSAFKREAIDLLGKIYEKRRQFPKAAVVWEKALSAGWDNHWHQNRLNQLIKNWGDFEGQQPQQPGENAQFQFRFRNASKVSFVAFKIDMSLMLSDLVLDIKSGKKLKQEETSLYSLWHNFVNGDRKKYVLEEFDSWEEKLLPRPDHFDDVIRVKAPFSEPGTYLVSSNVENGNESSVLLFISDTTIVQKNLDGKRLFYIADSKTGAPLPNMNVEFFSYDYHNERDGTLKVRAEHFVLNSNENGLVISDKILTNYRNWLIIARGGDNRLAYSGFQSYWGSYNNNSKQTFIKNGVYGITDRPVYKPSQNVNFKFWSGVARYDGSHDDSQKNKDMTVMIYSPKGIPIWSKSVKTDEYGGANGVFELPSDASLGVYKLAVSDRGTQTYAVNFRVEEYKKPEFEVKVQMPKETVKIGETFKAKIEAKYYFGSPVTTAKVKYKVLRVEQDFTWHPARQWDWLYGNGYGWFCYDYDWYPGWGRWGCRRPYYWWWHRPAPQPEVIMENEVAIDEDGTAELKIETQVFKELYGDKSHRFQVIAEVVDASRRVIVGQGDIIVTNQPFKVFAWLDKGYYDEKDKVIANFQARTVNGSPIKGKGVVLLYEIKYNKDLVPIEKKIRSKKIETDFNGKVEYEFNAPKSGQYRLAFELESDKGEKEEGAVVFTVFGSDLEKNNLRFNDLEILTKEVEYKPDDLMNLRINTNAEDSTVLLFLRPLNGVYQEPEVLTLKNKSFDKSVLITKSDMPNFFVEALTVRNGKVHVIAKEIIVPPENKALNVEIIPDLEKYKPGQESVVNVKVTDMEKKPFQGSLVVSVYDKAIDYISGGGNTSNIKDFYWKMKRAHTPETRTISDFVSYNISRSGIEGMWRIGHVGRLVRPGMFEVRTWRFKDDYSRALSKTSALSLDATVDRNNGSVPQFLTPIVRKDFSDSAYWNGSLVTDLNGMAQIKFKIPENLTTWKINSWVMGANVEVGYETKDVITTKDILIRLQAPRFFVEKDEVVLSGIVHNYFKEEQKIKVVFEQFGDCISDPDNSEVWVTVPSNGESRVDWRVKVVHPGEAKIRMSALSVKESDSMEMSFPVLVHGIMKRDSFSGKIKPESDLSTIVFKVPEERKPEASELVINYTPSLAGTMIDALPYLVGYPYGCAEQTLNRFIPTVIAQNVLLKMNLDLEDIRQKKIGLDVDSNGLKKGVRNMERWRSNPVFDAEEVKKMTKIGLERLYSMQNSDGGWGWFFDGENGRSDAHTTAIVVHGLGIAEKNNIAIHKNNLDRGINWLERHQEKRVIEIKGKPVNRSDNVDALVYKILAENNRENEEMRELLLRDKSELSVYGLCLMGMGFHALKLENELKEVMKSIDDYLEQDEKSQTVWLNVNKKYRWYWYGSKMETNALYLSLLVKTMPKSEKASRLVAYLLNNKERGAYWSSTRDTALCIEAIATYWQESGELNPSLTVEIWLDGKKKKTVEINEDNLFDFDSSFRLAGEAVTSGKHTIELRKIGKGALYYNASVSYFSKEDFIPKAGLDLRVERKIYKLVKDETQQMAPDKRGNVVKQRGDKMRRVLINNSTMLKSGDLLEIEITVDSNDYYEYLCLEDPKAAGFETVDMKSGYNGNALRAYVEYRNDKVVMFTTWLNRGKYSVSYKVRAEIPGKFSALPTQIYAMYSPELRGNSDENKIIIVD